MMILLQSISLISHGASQCKRCDRLTEGVLFGPDRGVVERAALTERCTKTALSQTNGALLQHRI